MVPVRLQLRNFLSYGETGEPLDFSSFHVACLSGGNGQGKSALLDAITWAIWGEARKSSDQRKPDEEILRIGARDMEVDLTFDLDGTRYRIVRSYQQSASGKTSKPGLEVQVLDRDSGAFTPLTAESVKASQAVIDARIGIDYETFINSTFLLQGRSDEFTKKRPTERKQILAKILGLDRYDRLSARAAARWSRLREQATRIDAEVERLTRALEPLETWTAERETVAAELAEATTLLTDLDAVLADLSERITRFDAAEREAAGHRAALEDLDARRKRLEDEHAALEARIEQAEALVAQAESIEAAHARYEALRAERKTLDEKATLHRGIEAQIHALDLDARKRTADAEAELVKLEARVATLTGQIEEDERRVASRERVEGERDRAQQARVRAEALERTRALRDVAERKRALARTEVAQEAARLQERRASLREAIQSAAAQVPPDAAAVNALGERLADARQAAEQQATVRTEGKEVGAALESLDERKQEIEQERTRIAARRERILTADVDDCPTCGTPLTAEHRATVAADYDAQIEALTTRVVALEERIARGVGKRDALRTEFKTLATRASSLDSLQAEHAAAIAAQSRAAETADRLDAQRAALAEVEATIEADTFAPEHRAAMLEADEALSSNPYSTAEHQQATAQAAGLARLEKDLVDIESAAARLEERRAQHAAGTEQVERLRRELDAGEHLAAITSKRAALATQIDAIGFDAAAHDRVSRELDGLMEAPARLARLLEARRSLAEWSERKAEIRERLRDAETARTERTAALDALKADLAGRADALAERTTLQARRDAQDARRTAAVGRLGGLDQRLQAAAADRDALAERRRELREVKKERALYGHLKRAFGRNGIPSLIIEETLPEVEDRANALLDRLTDGGTHVTLETLKDKKAGGTKETLDIRITDAQGVARAYETFSGGEAFRVNFALRIALSQMLAERSGRRIRTLVIDEGFGTQDEQGLQNLIGAIRAIQDDFDKVIVITHLDELKAAFPVRIEVTKQPVVGSTYEIVGV